MAPDERPPTISASDDDLATMRAWLAAQAQRDPNHKRFGAASHRYALRPPLPADRLAALETAFDVALPTFYRRWLVGLGDGGAGPFHGLWPLDHEAQRATSRGVFDPARPGAELYAGVIALGHVGCGQIAFLPLHGPHRGQVWLDARAADAGVLPIAANFETYVAAWVQATSRDELPPRVAGLEACPLPRTLSHYLTIMETRWSIEPGTMSRDETRKAFAVMPPGSIRVPAKGRDPYFAAGAALSLCASCELLMERLGPDGLPRDRVVSGENWPPAG